MEKTAQIQKSKVYVDSNGVMRGFKKPDKIYMERFNEEDKEYLFVRRWLTFFFFSFIIAMATSYLIIKGG